MKVWCTGTLIFFNCCYTSVAPTHYHVQNNTLPSRTENNTVLNTKGTDKELAAFSIDLLVCCCIVTHQNSSIFTIVNCVVVILFQTAGPQSLKAPSCKNVPRRKKISLLEALYLVTQSNTTPNEGSRQIHLYKCAMYDHDVIIEMETVKTIW